MIVSDKYKFIFIRTAKTAGTSTSDALERMVSDGDLVADMSRPSWSKFSPVHHGALKRTLPQLFGLHVHATAAQIRSVIGAEKFNSYYKFCVERNPWDRQVSLYFQRYGKRPHKRPPDFDRDMRSFLFRNTEYVRLNNWEIYTIKGDVVADRVIDYDNLEEGLEEVRREVGLPAPIDLPRHRSGHRPEKQNYRQHYSDATRDMIARWYAKEIRAFDYAF